MYAAREKVFIIAEAGVNHNGSLDMALQMVETAARAGVDAVKFQAFKSGDIVSATAPKAVYQKSTSDPRESQLDMLRSLELNECMHRTLAERCRELGLEFISTAFDMESLDMVVRIGVKRLKISSGEIESGPLLLAASRTGLPVILSTGVCGLADVETALGVLAFGYLRIAEKPCRDVFSRAYISSDGHKILREKVTLLHCATEYPCPMEDVNLRAISTMREAFGLPVGLSDHSMGISATGAAVALGATVIEKHFTLDRNMPGPDHQASLEPDELNAMVEHIRLVESALGTGRKLPAASEVKNRAIIRKSLVARRDIAAGEPFSEENLTFKRPGGGVSPLSYWDYLGRPASRPYRADEEIDR